MLYYRDNHLWVESNVPMCVSELAWKNMWRQHTATEHAHVNVFSSGGGEFMICKKIIHEQLNETNRVRLEVEVWLFLTYFPPHKENSKVSNPAAPTRISVLITYLINNSYPPYPLTTHSGYIPSHLTLAVRRSHIFSCRKAEDTILKERC